MGIVDRIMGRKERQEYSNEISKAMNRVTGVSTGWQWGLTQFELDLTAIDLEKTFYNNPIVYKGINKKARDMVFHGFEIDCPLDGVDVPENVEEQIKDFINQKEITKKMYEAVKEAWWKGDGWIEWVCAGNKIPDQPLNGTLVDIVKVDTKTIAGWKFKEGTTEVEFWKQTIDGKPQWIHASRLYHIQFNRSPVSLMGVSPIEIANRAIKADNDATKALGDNLDMFGHPFPTINTTDDSTYKQVDDAYAALNKLKKKGLKVGFAGFKNTKFGLLNPANPSPEPSLKHFYIELAAALEMPMQLVTGSQMSKLTGNEIELDDYYKSVKSYQNIYLTPVYNQMFILLLGGQWKDNYSIEWNKLYVNEEAEIKNKALIMEKVGDLYSKHQLTDLKETRQLLREYGIEIPENGQLDTMEEEPFQEEEEQLPYVEPEEEQNAKSDKTWTFRQATPLDLELEKNLKEQGKKEIKEQEKRLKEAKKKK